MKQGQFIRYLLDLLIAVVIYLVSSLMTKSLYDIQISGILLIFMFTQIIILRQLIDKFKNNNIVRFVAIMAIILLSVVVQGWQFVVGNLLLLGVQGILIIYFDSKEIDKEYYYKVSKIILGILVFSTLFRAGIDKSFLNAMNKIYLLILLLSIVLLRSTRNYEKKIKEKNEKIKILGIVVLIYLICNEKVYSVIFNIIEACIYGILNIVSFILGIILYPIAMLLFAFIKHLSEGAEVKVQSNAGGGVSEIAMESYKALSAGTSNIIQFVIIVAIVIAIYFIMTKIKDNKNGETETEGEIIIREKIEPIVKVNKKSKEKLYIGTDNNTIIKKMFYDIQYRLKKKELYNHSNTATEVISDVLKGGDDRSSINQIYNKAKFSNITISDNELESAKNQYSMIKSEIKNIKIE